MPRIEIIPHGWEQSAEKVRGDSTPTFDACHACDDEFRTGNDISNDDYPLLDDVVDGVIGSTEVAHPPYEGEGYRCNVCDKPLTGEDD